MSDREYKNTIYLKNGTKVFNENAENLAEQVSATVDWSKGTIALRSKDVITVIPKYYVAAINSEMEGDPHAES